MYVSMLQRDNSFGPEGAAALAPALAQLGGLNVLYMVGRPRGTSNLSICLED